MRRWKQITTQRPWIAERCQSLTDNGFTVHTILPNPSVKAKFSEDDWPHGFGATIIAYVDEPDLSGGVPR